MFKYFILCYYCSSKYLNLYILRIEGKKYENLVKFLKEMDSTKLNEWELDFCKSVIDKLDKYDNHILLSQKQHNVLRKIYDKQNN